MFQPALLHLALALVPCIDLRKRARPLKDKLGVVCLGFHLLRSQGIRILLRWARLDLLLGCWVSTEPSEPGLADWAADGGAGGLAHRHDRPGVPFARLDCPGVLPGGDIRIEALRTRAPSWCGPTDLLHDRSHIVKGVRGGSVGRDGAAPDPHPPNSHWPRANTIHDEASRLGISVPSTTDTGLL